ncbi:hypothetical protein Dda3937_04477 [Dickeya dadantii 3937]|uniref:Uncharacterized protein n=1 Tax=Dickeya dadantii (strain 3937) TaxID=198628 RepID=E0SAJ6_DICD3|nr:hypothetical protein Dda3937_04477 [Dickeya dadantii 3937]
MTASDRLHVLSLVVSFYTTLSVFAAFLKGESAYRVMLFSGYSGGSVVEANMMCISSALIWHCYCAELNLI